ncbi:MAG: hypothetical protein AAF621_04135 [Pseudomonadota bacterium]
MNDIVTGTLRSECLDDAIRYIDTAYFNALNKGSTNAYLDIAKQMHLDPEQGSQVVEKFHQHHLKPVEHQREKTKSEELPPRPKLPKKRPPPPPPPQSKMPPPMPRIKPSSIPHQPLVETEHRRGTNSSDEAQAPVEVRFHNLIALMREDVKKNGFTSLKPGGAQFSSQFFYDNVMRISSRPPNKEEFYIDYKLPSDLTAEELHELMFANDVNSRKHKYSIDNEVREYLYKGIIKYRDEFGQIHQPNDPNTRRYFNSMNFILAGVAPKYTPRDIIHFLPLRPAQKWDCHEALNKLGIKGENFRHLMPQWSMAPDLSPIIERACEGIDIRDLQGDYEIRKAYTLRKQLVSDGLSEDKIDIHIMNMRICEATGHKDVNDAFKYIEKEYQIEIQHLEESNAKDPYSNIAGSINLGPRLVESFHQYHSKQQRKAAAPAQHQKTSEVQPQNRSA